MPLLFVASERDKHESTGLAALNVSSRAIAVHRNLLLPQMSVRTKPRRIRRRRGPRAQRHQRRRSARSAVVSLSASPHCPHAASVGHRDGSGESPDRPADHRRYGDDMTLPDELTAKIRRLHYAEHWPLGTIATQLDVHRDAVEHALALDQRKPRARTPRVTDPFVPFLREVLAEYPTVRASRLFDMAKDRGYAGSYRRLRATVAELRPRPARQPFVHVTALVGEQAQIDWAHLGQHTLDGTPRDLWVFVMTLSWSRAIWAEFVYDLSIYSVLRSLARGADFFGGVTRQWLFDNPKTVVLDRSGSAVRFHPALLDFAAKYHVDPRACPPRKPEHKGRVERSVRYLRDRHFAARTFSTIERGNAELLAFLHTVSGARPHPDQPARTVAEMLDDEKRHLMALPAHRPSTDQVTPASVNKYGYVRFDKNDYAAPGYTRDTVTLVASEKEVRLMDGLLVIARHRRSYGRRQRVGVEMMARAIAEVRPGADAASARSRLLAASPGMDALFLRWLHAGRNMGSVTARAIHLLGLYDRAIFAEAVEEMNTRGLVDIGALATLCDQRRRARNVRPPVQLTLGDHIPDRDVASPNLDIYDDR